MQTLQYYRITSYDQLHRVSRAASAALFLSRYPPEVKRTVSLASVTSNNSLLENGQSFRSLECVTNSLRSARTEKRGEETETSGRDS